MQDTAHKWMYSTLDAKRINRSSDPVFYYTKRVIDTVLASIVTLLLAPLMLLVAIAIRLDSPGPVFFVQRRVGSRRVVRNGRVEWEVRPFNVFKFRSMVQNADDALHRAYIEAFVKGEVEESDSERSRFKLTGDPRITRVGRIIRKTSLDELPQLFNVLRGEMSLVGPRPVPEYEVEQYSQAWHYDRLLTLPGITGLWQVEGRCLVEFDEMIRMDLDYVRRQSPWLDFMILVKTIPAVIRGDGAE